MNYINKRVGKDLSSDLAERKDCYNDYLEHHGTKGQKWGLRRYQNEDGSLTEVGKARYKKLYDKREALVKKLAKKNKQLEKADSVKRQMKIARYETRAARLRRRSIRNMRRATSRLPSLLTGDKGRAYARGMRLERRSLRYATKANRLKSSALRKKRTALYLQKKLGVYDKKLKQLETKS